MVPSRRRSVNPNAILSLGLAVLEIVASWSPAFVLHHRRTQPQLLPRPDASSPPPIMALFASGSSEHQEESSTPVERHDGNVTDLILSRVNKKIRVAKAQSEIDRILAGPDAPFDAETELKKVVSIAASSPVTPPDSIVISSSSSSSSRDNNNNDEKEENNVEETSDQMETILYQAVREKDFSLAATKKHELEQMQMDDALAVLQVNSAFYRSFSQRDVKLMNSIWASDENSICINPSSPPLIGGKAIAAAWEQMFAAGTKFQSWVEPTNIRIAMRGATTAVVTCDEMVFARRFVRGQRRKSEKINTLVATNIFRKISNKWLMAHHHSSWHHESDVARYALNASTMNRLSSEGQQLDDVKAVQKDAGIKMDGILGAKNFGPMLGDQLSMLMKGNQNSNVKMRMVRGNLADLFSGNLKDILGSGGNSSPGGRDSSDAIIEFHELNRGDDDDEDEDEDDEEDYDDDGEMYSSDDVEADAASIVRRFSDSKSNAQDRTKLMQRRQSCIRLLRQLCGKGAISPKQKRVLLTDIIACSAKEEASLVEAAYELLCDGEDVDAAEEDFADQCRVLAGTLIDQ